MINDYENSRAVRLCSTGMGWRFEHWMVNSMGTNRTGLILFLSIDSISSVEL